MQYTASYRKLFGALLAKRKLEIALGGFYIAMGGR